LKIHAEENHPVDYGDVMLAKDIGDALEECYAGWGWAVNVNSEQGVLYVRNLIIEGQLQHSYGFMIKLSEINHTQKSVRKKAIDAGGEILERAGVERGPYKGQKIKFVEGVKFSHQPLEHRVKEIEKLIKKNSDMNHCKHHTNGAVIWQ
jgi:hypothetical protein